MSEIKDLEKIVEEFISKRDWNRFHTPKNIVMSIAIEAAELLEIFQWYTNEECADPEFISNNKADIEDEVADVLIYTLSLVNTCGLNLYDIIKKKMKRNESRFPIETVKGKLG